MNENCRKNYLVHSTSRATPRAFEFCMLSAPSLPALAALHRESARRVIFPSPATADCGSGQASTIDAMLREKIKCSNHVLVLEMRRIHTKTMVFVRRFIRRFIHTGICTSGQFKNLSQTLNDRKGGSVRMPE